ncbi:SDR family oxidoreductase [Agromyces subbeticus]|uniref:SDR family oxidoreductase n=1 Tax=Agromyces subbeticus TaxID=293890 RepID=UPI0003B710F4|nr:SDR family oxidoreductase [Agromyces subbeticus]
MSLGTLFSLEGRSALVTGGGTGIGRGIAHGLARAGASVIVVGRSAAVDQTRDEIETAGGSAVAIRADLSDRAALAGLTRDREIDVLVNCAGMIRRGPFLDVSDDDWHEVIAVNLDAPRRLSRLVGAGMLARRRGKIINIASLLSFQGGREVAGYTVSKHALVGLTRALANEWAGGGVQVNAIAPGYIATDNTAPLRADADRDAEILSRIPSGRWGTPDDLVGAAVFLASPASDYVTGHTLVVDGGWMSR